MHTIPVMTGRIIDIMFLLMADEIGFMPPVLARARPFLHHDAI
jgi:hypothetical protein